MTVHLHTQADLEDAMPALVSRSAAQADLRSRGHAGLRRREPGFAGLAQIVCGQQLSTERAAIWGRSGRLRSVPSRRLRNARADRLGRLGLSAAKIKTLKDIARELVAERLNSTCSPRRRRCRARNADRPARHRAVDRRHLSAVLSRPWRCMAGRRSRGSGSDQGRARPEGAPDRKQMAPLAEPWRPLRGAAAHLWWGYYHAMKKREGVIADPGKSQQRFKQMSVAKQSSKPARITARKRRDRNRKSTNRIKHSGWIAQPSHCFV